MEEWEDSGSEQEETLEEDIGDSVRGQDSIGGQARDRRWTVQDDSGRTVEAGGGGRTVEADRRRQWRRTVETV